MGLDMYLYLRKRSYEGNCEKGVGMYPKELESFEEEIGERDFRSVDIKEDYLVGYWRKDNAIHKWFVDVCGAGVDECQEMYVDLSGAESLKELCEKVLSDHSRAEELLPTCSGFFFGDKEYDEWYFRSLEYTRDLMKKVIDFVKENKEYSIIYQASW